jgi:hypothetical protein
VPISLREFILERYEGYKLLFLLLLCGPFFWAIPRKTYWSKFFSPFSPSQCSLKSVLIEGFARNEFLN